MKLANEQMRMLRPSASSRLLATIDRESIIQDDGGEYPLDTEMAKVVAQLAPSTQQR